MHKDKDEPNDYIDKLENFQIVWSRLQNRVSEALDCFQVPSVSIQFAAKSKVQATKINETISLSCSSSDNRLDFAVLRALPVTEFSVGTNIKSIDP